MIYLDSSVLLADYLGQSAASWARSAWDRDEDRVSSFVLLAEVPAVLRRSFAGVRGGARGVQATLSRFDEDLASITILLDAASVVEIVKRDARFAAVRTLEALHAASAWHAADLVGSPVTVLTTDVRLGDFCASLGLKVEMPDRPRRRRG